MIRVPAICGAMFALSLATAQAAIVSYDFEGAAIGAVSTSAFAGALNSLGITSSTVTGTGGGVIGVYLNDLANNGIVGVNTAISFGRRSFAPGSNGSWTLVFGNNGTTNGVTRFDFAYNETETSGFDVTYYGLDGSTVLRTANVRPAGHALSQCQFASTCTSVNYSNTSGIGRVVMTDLGSDNFGVDNITVDTILLTATGGGSATGGGTTATDTTPPVSSTVPELSSYAMIGTALASLSLIRRRS